jgi:spore coat protein CotF
MNINMKNEIEKTELKQYYETSLQKLKIRLLNAKSEKKKTLIKELITELKQRIIQR